MRFTHAKLIPPLVLTALTLPVSGPARAAADDLFDMSIGELMNVVVTLASRKEEPLTSVTSAVFVIDRETIRRSGMTSVPELLRLVPGMHVARINGNSWSISSRGFSGVSASKLLVMVDGRSVYTPLFAGVYWDVQQIPLEHIEQIEVIRGPGGTLWGANAVSGVINIVTRDASDTPGGTVSGYTGSLESGALVSYGLDLGENGNLRAYFQSNQSDPLRDEFGNTLRDGWDTRRAGFRWDVVPTARDMMTFSGDFYEGGSEALTIQTLATPPYRLYTPETVDLDGGNLRFDWRRTRPDDTTWELQIYYDSANRQDLNLYQKIDTFDIDFQRHLRLGDRHEVIWGAGYRRVSDNLEGSFTISFDPASEVSSLVSTFINDEISLSDKFRVVVGTKIEHNHFTGSEHEVQPSFRANWQLNEHVSIWSAVSKAIEVPTRSHLDMTLNIAAFPVPFDPDGPGPAPATTITGVVTNTGADTLSSVELIARELGYRSRVSDRLLIDVVAFDMDYSHLGSGQMGVPRFESSPMPTLRFPVDFVRLMSAHTGGVELAVDWQASSRLNVSGSVSLFTVDAELNGATDVSQQASFEGDYPGEQLQLHASYEVKPDILLSFGLYHVGELDNVELDPNERVSAYTRFDASVVWKVNDDFEFSIIGQNLSDDLHREYIASERLAETGYVSDSVLARVTWHW